VTTDWRVLLFTAAVAVLAGIFFGILPAFISTRVSLTSAMKGPLAQEGEHRRRYRFTKSIVAAQVAVSVVLLLTAGLFLRSFWKLATVNMGFDRENVLLVRLNLRNGNVPETQRSELCDEIWKVLRDMPGVASVSQSALTPIMGMGMPSFVLSRTPGAPTGKSPDLSFGAVNLIFINFVSPNYFATLRTSLLSGRDFTEADIAQAQAVSIISETMAHKFFPGLDPIGRYFTTEQFPRQAQNKFLVIGVVNDMKYMDIREDFHPVAYFPITQLSLFPDLTNFDIRTKLSQASMEKAVVAAVASVDSNIPMQFSTLQEQVSNAMIQDRILAMLTAFFGVLALLLVLIGLYGVVSYVVAQRTPEIGIRMALGATRRNVLRLVMGQSVVTILIGTGMGVIGSILATRYLSSLLYGITPTDPLTLASVLVLLIVVASLAIYIPARRATRVDPMVALRNE
jgi:putative ABC transport system permease protein